MFHKYAFIPRCSFLDKTDNVKNVLGRRPGPSSCQMSQASGSPRTAAGKGKSATGDWM